MHIQLASKLIIIYISSFEHFFKTLNVHSSYNTHNQLSTISLKLIGCANIYCFSQLSNFYAHFLSQFLWPVLRQWPWLKVAFLTSNNFSTSFHELLEDFCFLGYLICRLNKTHGSPLRPLSSVASLAFNANWSKTIMEFIRTYWTPEQALTIRGLLNCGVTDGNQSYFATCTYEIMAKMW